MAQPIVGVRVCSRSFRGRAEVSRRTPNASRTSLSCACGGIRAWSGESCRWTACRPVRAAELSAYAAHLALVIVHPLADGPACGSGRDRDATMKA